MFQSGIQTKWGPGYKPLESRSRWTRSLILTAGSPACMTLREIRLNCGSLRFQTPKARLQSGSLFLDCSWVGRCGRNQITSSCLPIIRELVHLKWTTSALGILGAFWRRKVIEDTEQIAIRICHGKLMQTPRL